MTVFYREIKLDIPGNGQEVFNAQGSRVAILDIAGSLEMRIGNSPRSNIRAGMAFGLPFAEDFTELRFFENTGSTAQITFAYGEGDIVDSRLTASGALTTFKGSTLETSAAVTAPNGGGATLLKAADNDRLEIALTSGGGGDVWIGDSNVSASNTRGIKLPDGGTIFLETSAAVYADNNSGSNVDIAISEIKQ